MPVEYKKYIPKHLRENPEINGLGDFVEAKITAPLGIKRMVKVMSKFLGIKDCGCGQRKEAMNNSPISKAIFKKE